MDARAKQYFTELKRAGQFAGSTDVIVTQAGSVSQGEVIELSLRVKDDIVIDAKYRVHGGPYAFAAIAFVADWVIGSPLSELQSFSFQQILESMDFPPEKKHSALLVEDLMRKLG